MKLKLNNKSISENFDYKGYIIIDNSKNGTWKIKDSSGKFIAGDFSSDEDAKEFIDDRNRNESMKIKLFGENTTKPVNESVKTFKDEQGIFSIPGATVTMQELIDYWKNNYTSDPCLIEYNDFDDWFKATSEWLVPEKGIETEAKASAIDLSTIEGTMSKVLIDHKDELNKITSVKELVTLLTKLFKENNINTPASRRLVMNIMAKKRLEDAQFALYNSILKGCSVGVLKEDAPLDDEAVSEDDDLKYLETAVNNLAFDVDTLAREADFRGAARLKRLLVKVYDMINDYEF